MPIRARCGTGCDASFPGWWTGMTNSSPLAPFLRAAAGHLRAQPWAVVASPDPLRPALLGTMNCRFRLLSPTNPRKITIDNKQNAGDRDPRSDQSSPALSRLAALE